MTRKTASETWLAPIQRRWVPVVFYLIGHLPDKQTHEHEGEPAPYDPRPYPPRVRKVVEKMACDEISSDARARRQEATQRAGPNGEVRGEVVALVRSGPLAEDEDGYQQQDALRADELPDRLRLGAPRRLLQDHYPRAVITHHLLWRRERERERQTAALKRDQHQVGRVPDLARRRVAHVQPKIDSTANELANIAYGQPERSVAASFAVLWVAQDDGGFGRPEAARR